MPVGGTGFGSADLWQVVTWGSTLFSGALSIALPGITALLIVNLAFGMVSRAAPSLNLMAVGFPVILVFACWCWWSASRSCCPDLSGFWRSPFVLLQSLSGARI